MTLSEARLLAGAGERVFYRGVDYMRYVRGLRVVGTTASGTIQARNVYPVELDWSRNELDGHCTCPHFAEGNFCKHLVALGLCVIDDGHVESVVADDVVEMVRRIEIDDLRSLVIDLARRDGSVLRELELRQAVAGRDLDRLGDDLVALVQETMSFRGFIDYRRSFEAASDVEVTLDELERCLDAGAADAARPALLKAITRLRKIVEQADDSAGVLGNACQRAAELYARACRDGDPDGLKVAEWLVKFRGESPGWPELELADFDGVFDDRAMRAYRKAVDALSSKRSGEDRWRRFEVDRMLLELADHDGDVDRAIELLSRGDHTAYGEIVARLEAADRRDDAVAWVDRAVAAGRVSGRGGGNGYWLDPVAVGHTYLELGRVDDALAVMFGEFSQSPGFVSYRQLIGMATEVGRAQEMRTLALSEARHKAAERFGSGATLIEIALGENDLDSAWAAAEEFGTGHEWQRLAEASARSRPIDAAELYRPGIDQDLARGPNTKVYPGIASRLATMKQLYASGGAPERFDEYIADLRDEYGRRPSLMKAFVAAGL